MERNCKTLADYAERAELVVRNYRLVLEDDGASSFLGTSIEMPNVFAHGTTADICVNALRHNLTLAVCRLLQAGRVPPRSGQLQLSEQLNFRLTAEEKMVLESAASQSGLKLSDFVRQQVIARPKL